MTDGESGKHTEAVWTIEQTMQARRLRWLVDIFFAIAGLCLSPAHGFRPLLDGRVGGELARNVSRLRWVKRFVNLQKFSHCRSISKPGCLRSRNRSIFHRDWCYRSKISR